MANEVDKPTVPHNSNHVHEAEWQRDPDMRIFQSRDTIQDKEVWGQAGAVGSRHNGWQDDRILYQIIMSVLWGKCINKRKVDGLENRQ